MTNCNERLDKILKTSHHRIRTRLLRDAEIYQSHILQSEYEAKAALTSLIKELVAEAKPINKQGEIDIDVPAYNDGYYSGANNALEKFEQNLLKALEEV